MSNNNTLDLTEITSGPVESNVQVEITDAPDDVEEPEETESTETEETESTETEETEEIIEPVIATPDPEPVIATPDPEPVIATPDPEPVIATPDPEPVETVRTEEPVAPVSPAAPVEQVAADIRSILTEVPTVSEDNVETVESVDNLSGLSDDLKQRIAELDYLRECCGNWVGTRRVGKSNFLTAWENKNVTVNSNVNYEDVLVQLEKMPEIVKLWAERKVNTDSNHFKNIESYTLNKSLFNEKNVEEKVKVLEQLVGLLTDCANGIMRTNKIEEVIDNLY